MTDAKYQILFMTASSADEARRIARQLVEEQLAACINIVQACRSVYRWKGGIVDDGEVMMFAKVRKWDFRTIEQRVTALHSYDVPEVIALSVVGGSEDYLRWLDGEIHGSWHDVD